MTEIVSLCAITGGLDLTVSNAELNKLGLSPGSFTLLSGEQMEAIRLALENSHGKLPIPNMGGSVANTTDLLARIGISAGIMGIGGNDPFGRAYLSNCIRSSVELLTELEDGAVTGYDFYLADENDVRTIILTHGANALLSPSRINIKAVQGAKLLLLDGSTLSYGPESEAALRHCIRTAEQASVPFVLTLSSSRIINSYSDFFDSFAPKSQMVAGNLEQTAVLLGLEPDAPLSEVKAKLANTSINAIVTLDADGVFARFDGEEFLLPTREVEVVDSTGAGDNFLGAFLAASIRGSSIPKALSIGNIIAGEVVQYEHARLPMELDIPGLLQQAMHAADNPALTE